MGRLSIHESINKLGTDFPNLNWNFQEQRIGGRKELISQWLGESDEDIMVCAFKGKEIHEKFHRQDFFFFKALLASLWVRNAAFPCNQATLGTFDFRLGSGMRISEHTRYTISIMF